MSISVSGKPYYENSIYSFKLRLDPDYKVDYLPSGEGVLMKKWIKEHKDPETKELIYGYKVEISVFGQENVWGYETLADFIEDKYSGYNLDFRDFENTSGVIIDEGDKDDAIRHYFLLAEGDMLLEANLKAPSMHILKYNDEFEDVLKTIEVF